MAVTGGGRLVVVAGVLGAALTLSRQVQAQPSAPERSFSLAYRAPSGCSDAAALSDAIKARSADATAVAVPTAAVHLTVEISRTFDSSLWVDLPEGSFRRQFQAGSCAEAVESVALIAAMVLDAAPDARRAMTQFPAEPAAGDVPVGAAPTPAESAAVVTEVVAAPPSAPPQVLARPPQREHRALVHEASPSSRLIWRVAADAAIESAVAPSPPIGAALGIESWLQRPSLWSPSIRLGLLATVAATEHATAGDGTFRLLTSQLRLCPARWAAAPAFRLLACAQFEAGSLSARGGGSLQHLQQKTMPWLAGGVSVRAELELVGALALEGGASAAALARHDSFVFHTFSGASQGPDSLVYRVPVGSFGFDLGLLLRLP